MSEIFSMDHLISLIESEDIDNIKVYMDQHNLILDGDKIVPKNKKEFEQKVAFWDKRQYVREIAPLFGNR